MIEVSVRPEDRRRLEAIVALRSTWDVGRELSEGRLVRILPHYEGAHEGAIVAVLPNTALMRPNVVAFMRFFEALYARPIWEMAERS